MSSREGDTRMNSCFAQPICNYIFLLDKDRKHKRRVGSMCQYFDTIYKWILKGLAYLHSRHWRASLRGSEDNYYLLFRSTEESGANSSVVPRVEDNAAETRRTRFFTYRCWFARLRMHLVLVNCSSSPGQWRHVRRCSAPIWWRPDHQPRSIWICLRRSARGFLVKAWRKTNEEFQLLIAKSVRRQRDDGWKRRVLLWEVLSIHECLISEQIRQEKTLFTKQCRLWVFSFGWKKGNSLRGSSSTNDWLMTTSSDERGK